MQKQKFEKDIRQRMEELSFAPSEPVWLKVEEEIRKKKERRRLFFFWLFAGMLLFGSGYFFAKQLPGNRPVWRLEMNNSKAQDGNLEKEVLDRKIGTKESNAGSETETGNLSKEENLKNKSVSEGAQPVVTGSLGAVNKLEKYTAKIPAKPFYHSSTLNQDEQVAKPNNNSIIASDEQSIDTQITTPGFRDIIDPTVKVDTLESKQMADTTIQADTTSQTKIAVIKKKKPVRYWSLGASGGISGMNDGAFSFSPPASSNAQKAFSSAIGQASGQVSSGPLAIRSTSFIKPASGFSIGAELHQQLRYRLTLVAGLFYQKFTTITQVGQPISANNRLSFASDNRPASNAFLYVSNVFTPIEYRNKYHFIQVPVGVSWQVNRRLPLTLQTGFAIGKLVATNALYYDASNNLYYKNKSSFNKTQVHSYVGFSYRIHQFGLGALSAGPKFQLQLSNLMKPGYGQQYLYSLGIGAAFSFN